VANLSGGTATSAPPRVLGAMNPGCVLQLVLQRKLRIKSQLQHEPQKKIRPNN
jgi:hypothetical protein